MLFEDHFPLCKDEVEFEGRKYDVWKGYEKKLVEWYGDFWSFPQKIKCTHSLEMKNVDICIAFLKEKGII